MTCKYCTHWEPDIDPETGVGPPLGPLMSWAEILMGSRLTGIFTKRQ